MFGPAKTDALGPEAACGLGILRRLGVGANLHRAHLVDPFHETAEITGEFRLDGFGLAQHHLAPGAIEGNDVAGVDGLAARRQGLRVVVDPDLTGARHTGPAHAEGHHRRVARHNAPRCQDAGGRMHTADVFRAGFDPNQDDLVALGRHGLGICGIESDLARGRAGGSRQPPRQQDPIGRGIQHRVQQLVQLSRLDPPDRFLAGNHARVGHVDCNFQRGFSRPLAATGLQHEQLDLLYRELHILHVPVMGFEHTPDMIEFLEDHRHGFFHRRQVAGAIVLGGNRQRLGRAYTRNHVLALCVD